MYIYIYVHIHIYIYIYTDMIIIVLMSGARGLRPLAARDHGLQADAGGPRDHRFPIYYLQLPYSALSADSVK